jgi:hypothetical protein
MAETNSKQAINARRIYLRMRFDEIKSEMTRNLEEFLAITAALPKAAAGPERTAMRIRAEVSVQPIVWPARQAWPLTPSTRP